MRMLMLVVVCLAVAVPAFAQNSNPRFQSVQVGPSSNDIDISGSTGSAPYSIRFPNGGGLLTDPTNGSCYGLVAIDTDTGLTEDMALVCAASVPTINLNARVTVGGQALLAYTDTGSDAVLLFNTTTNQLQNLAYGGTCSLSSQTLTCTEPVWVYAGWGVAGFLGGAWMIGVAWPRLSAWRVRRRRAAWAA